MNMPKETNNNVKDQENIEEDDKPKINIEQITNREGNQAEVDIDNGTASDQVQVESAMSSWSNAILITQNFNDQKQVAAETKGDSNIEKVESEKLDSTQEIQTSAEENKVQHEKVINNNESNQSKLEPTNLSHENVDNINEEKHITSEMIIEDRNKCNEAGASNDLIDLSDSIENTNNITEEYLKSRIEIDI